MDKNTITGLVLIALILFGYSYYTSTTNPAVEENRKTEQTAAPAAQHTAKSTAVATPAVADSTQAFAAALTPTKEAPVVLENEKIRVTIQPKGGMVSRVELKNYKSYADYHAGRDTTLLLYNEKDAQMAFTLETKDANIETSRYYFTPEARTDSSVTMTLADGRGGAIKFLYTLNATEGLLNFSVRAENLEAAFSPKVRTMSLLWCDRVKQQEKGYKFESQYSTLTYKKNDGDTEKLAEQGQKTEKSDLPVEWIAFKNQYFSAVLIARQDLTEVELESVQLPEGSGYLKQYTASCEAAFDPSGRESTDFQFYFGPNHYRYLKSMDAYKITDDDNDLQDLVYLGWPLVKWINRFFTIYVFDFLTQLQLPMGIVLLLITILLRIIVYVPTRKSYLSSAKMRLLRPKIQEISAKYPNKEDSMIRAQETMTLQSQYGASPMSGCLPMLIQLPIWIAMFNFVPNAIELRQQSFLWADDLSTYDDVISWGTHIPFIGQHLSLFCLLFCATNVLYSYMTMRQQRDSLPPEQAQQMQLMQWMMYLMPIMFFFMFNEYSAGLNYYYFISLLCSALTMWYLRKFTDDAKLWAKMEEYHQKYKNNPDKKPSGLAARLAALQEQQQKMLEEQRRRNAGAR